MEDKLKEAMETINDHLCHGKAKGRHIVVLDRGWIFVGRLTLLEDEESYILTECKNIRRWSSGGFGGLTKSCSESGAETDDCRAIKFRKKAMIFCVPIGEDW